jgi:hypothetical protein
MKVTMKIEESAHKDLQMAKALLGVKTLSEAIKVLSQNYIELHMRKVRK